MKRQETIKPVVHRPENGRFETEKGAYLSYQLNGKTAVFNHTYVPDQLRGQGVAAVLTKAALQHAEAAGWRIEPVCSYTAEYIQRHDEYLHLLAEHQT